MKYTINGLMEGRGVIGTLWVYRSPNIVGKRGLGHSDGKVTIDISYVWNSIEVTKLFPREKNKKKQKNPYGQVLTTYF